MLAGEVVAVTRGERKAGRMAALRRRDDDTYMVKYWQISALYPPGALGQVLSVC